VLGRNRTLPVAPSRAYSESKPLMNWIVLLKLIFHFNSACAMRLVPTNKLGSLAFVKGQLLATVLEPLNDVTGVVQFSHQMLKFSSDFPFSENVFRTPKNVIVTSLCVNSLLGYGIL